MVAKAIRANPAHVLGSTAMIEVCIGNDCRSLRDADANWVASEINNRRRDGQTICVRVSINEDGLNLSLASPGCGSGGGGGRQPRPEELRVLELWDRHRLNLKDPSPGDLISFLRQLDR